MDNFHNISKFIKENDLELFTDVSDDLICIICKRIMTNATSAPCRCRYCYECIKQYLNGKSKLFCPGSAKYCKIDKLNFKRDIHVDSMINSRISKLIVKCPQKTCEFKSELNLIKDHIEICDKRFVDCPYLQLGCSKEDVQFNNMTPHLYEDSFIHNKLLIEYINNFKNDVEILKNNMKTMADENVSLINENKTMKEEIKNLLSENETTKVLFTQNNEKLKESIENIEEKQNDVEILKNNMKTMADENVNLINENKTMKEEIKNLLSENETTKVLFTQNNEKLKESIENIEEKQKSFEDIVTSVTALSERSKKLLTYIVSVDENLDSTNDKLEDIEDKILTLKKEEFVWKIDNILEKVAKYSENDSERKFHSESFFTHKNGYKMCLYIYPNKIPNNQRYLGVFFTLMKGPFDDILPWPCKIDVTTDLINQLTGTTFLSRTKTYESNKLHDVYKKPFCERNKGCGSLKFIKLDTLLNQLNLIENNQLFIKCRVRVNE